MEETKNTCEFITWPLNSPKPNIHSESERPNSRFPVIELNGENTSIAIEQIRDAILGYGFFKRDNRGFQAKEVGFHRERPNSRFPVIDLNGGNTSIAMEQIRDAIREYGFFKEDNRGFQAKEVGFRRVAREFANLPLEEKLKLYDDDRSSKARSVLNCLIKEADNGDVYGWTMYLRLHCINCFDFIKFIKKNPNPIQCLCAEFEYVIRFSIPASRDIRGYEHKKLLEYFAGGYGSNFDDESGSGTRHDHRHPLDHVPEVRIDMPRTLPSNHKNTILQLKGNDEDIDPVVYEEYIDHLKNSKPEEDYDPMKLMFGTLTAVGGQVVGGLAANRLTSSSTAGLSWPGPAVELATLLGLSVAMAGMSLRGKRSRQGVSALMIKIGAMVIAGAIIFSMGLHLPQGIAWIVGLVAFLIMAVAAAAA